MDEVFAAIDIGSNSTNLLIVDQSGKTLERIVRSTRLGANLATTGALSTDAIQRTLDCLSEYESLIKQHNRTRINFGRDRGCSFVCRCNKCA
jgi:exopolyphosphatase/guanosine-5'-triphosphate,3'-diphosphate pyrophosphatase